MVRVRSPEIPYCPFDYKHLRVEEKEEGKGRKKEEGRKILTVRG